MGSNPVQAWIFFRLYFHYCLSSVQHCKDHLQIHFLDRSLHKLFLYIFTVIVPNIATQLNLDNRSFTSERNEDLGKKLKMLKLNEPDTCDENDSAMPNLSHPWCWGSYTWTTFESWHLWEVETLILISSTVNARSSTRPNTRKTKFFKKKIHAIWGKWNSNPMMRWQTKKSNHRDNKESIRKPFKGFDLLPLIPLWKYTRRRVSSSNKLWLYNQPFERKNYFWHCCLL